VIKTIHEIRDPIHVFVRLDPDERKVLNSRPFQRLRHIHQLAFSYLVYPGATHRRFEHSLGVMELAGRVFDTNLNSRIGKQFCQKSSLEIRLALIASITCFAIHITRESGTASLTITA